MSKICRTCLQKCNRTYTTNQNLGVFGGETVRISYVLRFCIPELYLGLSSNPEICYNCKESLKVTYVFKKKCLFTEQVIGNYLKNTRSTGKSVDLYDVLAYTDIQQCLCQEEDKQSISQSSLVASANADGILPDWSISNQLKPSAADRLEEIEVRQSAPNPTNSKEIATAPVPKPSENMKVMKFCEETGLFVSQQKERVEYTGNMINKNLKTILQGHAPNNLANSVTNVLTPPATSSESDSICKIASVFSLSNEEENESGEKSAELAVDNENKDDSVQIKDEPLDIDVTEECVGFDYVPTDEDTLDASETGLYQNLECDANLQGIIDNIPEINDANHYVDVPEFVQINNFGLKELEELRRQQQKQSDNTGKNNPPGIQTNILSSEPPALISLNREKLHESAVEKKDEPIKNTDDKETSSVPSFMNLTPVEQDHLRLNPNVKIVELGPEHFTKIPEVVFIDGKKYMKFKNEFRFIPESKDESEVIILKKLAVTSEAGDKTGILLKRSVKPSFGLSSGDAVKQNNPTVSEPSVDNAGINKDIPAKINETVQPKPGRGRKKIKIVPVGEHKFAVLGPDVIKKNVHHIPVDKSTRTSSNDKDVVVLFTNFTMDGTYINDHDYLINPYKRNKVLIEEKDQQWLCMCYICDKKHHTHEHVRHMAKHEPKCKICQVDLGTPYMLNVHVKSHCKPCRQCTQRVPYGQIESHEHSHFMDELEFEKEPKRKYAHLRARRRRAKQQVKPSYVPIKPAPVRVEKSDPDNSLDDLDDTPLSALVDVKFEERASVTTQTRVPKKRGRKRKSEIKVEVIPEEGDETSVRVLRSKVRKLYTESESEDNDCQKAGDVVEDMSSLAAFEDIPSGVGPP